MNILKRHRNKVLMLIDMCMVLFSEFFTYFLLLSEYRAYEIGRIALMYVSAADVIISGIVFYFFRMYRVIWRYARIKHLTMCFAAALVSTFLSALFNTVVQLPAIVPPEAHFLRLIILTFFIMMSRIMYAVLFSYYKSKAMQDVSAGGKSDKKRLMIVGAGEMASLFFDDIGKGIPDIYEPVCIVDDDPAKIGRKLRDVIIVGDTEHIPEIAERERIEVIIVCIAHCAEKDKKRIFGKCYETSCHISKMVMGVGEGVSENTESKIRKISIDDLLGREAVNLENDALKDFIGGKTVMVTGGGGSIGSELCRHIALLKPKKLVILDSYENNAYDIQQELIGAYGKSLPLAVEIVSVCDEARMKLIFEAYKPEVVYHAAAHKHVPLMEHNPEEAVKNNVFGTYTTARLAGESGVKKFVLVSTDKAVNPTNIMGATKRCCEMIVQSFNNIYDTEFVAVRFGNVLGSNGSVIPLFEKQILNGGPVTVTHPDIIRYFMTIPEAVQLLLAAGGMAKGGEIFVLDMGEPVKIAELAKQVIKLSGLVPGRDIEIKYTGLRPGEKLYEELLMGEEGLKNTENKKIFIGKPIELDTDLFFRQLAELRECAYKNDIASVTRLIGELVPTYHKPERDIKAEKELDTAAAAAR